MSRDQPELTAAQVDSDDGVAESVLRFDLDQLASTERNLLLSTPIRQPTRQELCGLACKIYDARRARERIIEPTLFGEPAWDMLLALYFLPARGEMLRPTSLSHAASVPVQTGMRWQRMLTNRGLIERGPMELPSRRQFVRLTEKGRKMMERYLTRLFFAECPNLPFPDRAGG
jgi:DNA-binding MarR family transcriptional regulator